LIETSDVVVAKTATAKAMKTDAAARNISRLTLNDLH
jgi:hypothetical protein